MDSFNVVGRKRLSEKIEAPSLREAIRIFHQKYPDWPIDDEHDFFHVLGFDHESGQPIFDIEDEFVKTEDDKYVLIAHDPSLGRVEGIETMQEYNERLDQEDREFIAALPPLA